RGADRIGVSLGSHRPTVLLKLTAWWKKRTTSLLTYYPSLGTRRSDLSIYFLQPGMTSSSRRDFFFISPRLGRYAGQEP
ncbi:hypothetical protein ZWY2020_011260, partial [Hordeum vulgare]